MIRVLALLLLVGCASTGTTASAPSYLFVQNAESASLDGDKLVLEGLTPHAVVFSDRPVREAGYIANTKFLRAWERPDSSFAKEPPNATLAVVNDGKMVDVVVVLKNPRHEGARVTYDVEVLGGPKKASGGPAIVFIDNLAPWPEVRHGMHDEPNVVSRKGTHINR